MPATHPEIAPEEAIASQVAAYTTTIIKELLDLILKLTPERFEQLVVDVLVAMGYGGSRTDAGRAVGQSGDGGIDGIIKEDRLGLDTIYLQAKRWEGTVGRPEIQKFAGALQGFRARKGVFITSSSFSKEARDFATGLDSKLILIDGEELANLMLETGIGVTIVQTYTLVRVDEDYFER